MRASDASAALANGSILAAALDLLSIDLATISAEMKGPAT